MVARAAPSEHLGPGTRTARPVGALGTTTAATAGATSAGRPVHPVASAIDHRDSTAPRVTTVGAAGSSGVTTDPPVRVTTDHPARLGRVGSAPVVPGQVGSVAVGRVQPDHAPGPVSATTTGARPSAIVTRATVGRPLAVTVTRATDGHPRAVTAMPADRQIDGRLPSRRDPRSVTSGPDLRAVRDLAICCTDETPSWRHSEPAARSAG